MSLSEEENLIIIHADGYLQSITFPKLDNQGLRISIPPTEVFFDLLDVNVCNAVVCDIDSDSKNELVAIFVNGAVRSYRFEVDNDEGLRQILLWDFQYNIASFSLGRSAMNFFNAFVITSNHAINKMAFFPTTSVVPELKPCKDSCCIIPANCIFSTLYGSDVARIFVQMLDDTTHDSINRELGKPNQESIVCVGATVFRNGTQILVTADYAGCLCIYTWTIGKVSESEKRCINNRVCTKRELCLKAVTRNSENWLYLSRVSSSILLHNNEFINYTRLSTSSSVPRAYKLFKKKRLLFRKKKSGPFLAKVAYKSNRNFVNNDECLASSDENELLCVEEVSDQAEGSKQAYGLPWMPNICSKLDISPVHLTILESSEDNCLLIGVISLHKRVHVFRYQIKES